jgi:hypothetical protein
MLVLAPCTHNKLQSLQSTWQLLSDVLAVQQVAQLENSMQDCVTDVCVSYQAAVCMRETVVVT